MLESHWTRPGFCVPNLSTYPWQWLWDSGFHAVCWAVLGHPAKAIAELTNALAHQAADGFVPHITYWDGDTRHAAFWGRSGTSCITQPPMYGHAIAELRRRGVAVPGDLVDRARAGLHFLLEARARPGGGLVVVHPWETGCDDSPRWDAWSGPQGWSPARWWDLKGELVGAIAFDPRTGSPTASRRFEVASVGFNALVAFNAAELGWASGDAGLLDAAADLRAWLAGRWRPDTVTWADEVVVGPDASAAVRTLDALLPVLVCGDPAAVDAVFAQLRDPGAFAGSHGPAGVHRAEPAFDGSRYWRGPAWPQLGYLVWVAARNHERVGDASWSGSRLVAGADRSGLAEYWDPDDGSGLGAIPQSWSALAALVGADGGTA